MPKAGHGRVRRHGGGGGQWRTGTSGSFWLNQPSRVLAKVGQHRQTHKSEKVRPSGKDQGSRVELENLCLFLPQGPGEQLVPEGQVGRRVGHGEGETHSSPRARQSRGPEEPSVHPAASPPAAGLAEAFGERAAGGGGASQGRRGIQPNLTLSKSKRQSTGHC